MAETRPIRLGHTGEKHFGVLGSEFRGHPFQQAQVQRTLQFRVDRMTLLVPDGVGPDDCAGPPALPRVRADIRQSFDRACRG